LGACALACALAACGQKGPLFLPAQAGVAATSAASVPGAAAALPTVPGASSPGSAPAAH